MVNVCAVSVAVAGAVYCVSMSFAVVWSDAVMMANRCAVSEQKKETQFWGELGLLSVLVATGSLVPVQPGE